MKLFARMSVALGMMCLASSAPAALIITFNSPAANTQIEPNEVVPINYTVSNAVAGLSTISISGTRAQNGGENISGFGLNQNSFSGTYNYVAPSDLALNETVTITITASGVVDSAQTRTLNLVGPSAPPPANDNLSAPTELTGTTGTENATNAGATKESGESNHAGNPGGASIWFEYTAPDDGELTVDTAGSNIDTLMAIYTTSSAPGFSSTTLIRNNDDASGSVTTSAITFDVNSGQTYLIAVDGKDGATGDIVLNYSFELLLSANNWSLYQ